MTPGTRVLVSQDDRLTHRGRTGTFIRMDGGLFRIEIDGSDTGGLVQYPMLKNEIEEI